MQKVLLITTLLLATANAPAASVYRCDINGETVFSQQPCAPDAKEVELKYIKHNEEEAARAAGLHEQSAALSRQQIHQAKARSLQADIDKEIKAIATSQAQRDREVATLKRKINSRNNNLAGATWEQALAQEINAANGRHDSDTALHQANIDRLRLELDRHSAATP